MIMTVQAFLDAQFRIQAFLISSDVLGSEL